MKKEEADAFLKDWDEMDSSVKPLDYFSEMELESQKTILDWITIELESEIADYSLDRTIDTIEVADGLGYVRIMWFSKGMNDYYIALSSEAMFLGCDPEIPPSLIGDIHNVLMAFICDSN